MKYKRLRYSHALARSPFCPPLGICNLICIELQQLTSGVIMHNSVEKRSLYVNKWLSYSQL